MMKRINWERLLPLGMDWERAGNNFRRGFLCALLWSLKAPLAALISKSNMYAWIDNTRTIVDEMECIDWVLRGSWYGLVLIAVSMPFLALYFYSWHYQGSKSIYTMRRLPKRGELLRRCLTLPCITAALSLAVIPVLSTVYYGFYVLVTPAGHLPAGQWQLMWEGLLC